MKLSTRFTLFVGALFLLTVGFVWWLLDNRLSAAARTVAGLSAQLTEGTQRERELRTKLSAVAATQGAMDVAVRGADVLASFVSGRVQELKETDLPASFGGTAEEQAASAARILASAKALDQVIVTDGEGAVTAVVPANASLLGQPYLTEAEVAACRKSSEPRVDFKASDKSTARLITVVAGVKVRMGGRISFLGAVVEVVALENLLKEVTGGVVGETETRFMLVDKAGLIAWAPTPDLVGKAIKDSPELKVLMDAAEDKVVEANYDLRRWMAVRHPGPLGMTVIGFGAIGAGPAPGAVGTAPTPKAPILILGLAAAAGLAGILAIVLMPLGRLGSLAKSAQALAAGSASVEFKSAGAKDEIGEAARSLEKVGERLATELRHREETAQAYATLQRDLQRVQSENRELQEYQRNLEAKSRQQQAALEGEVAAARQELESARSELEGNRRELSAQQGTLAAQAAAVAARDTAISERDAALVQAGQQIQSLTEGLAALQQSVESLSGRLTEANTELDRRRSAPAAAFGLFAEASEALSVELAGLVELVQGYIGQLVEAGAITEEQQHFLSTVITRSARSQRLMGDLRDFSNIVRPDGLAREPIDLGALLTDVVGTAQEGAEARGIALDAEVPDLPEAMGDEGRLRQLFTVLFQNAIRFTPEGGTVTMRIGVREGVAGIRIEDAAESIPVKSEEVFDHFHPPDEEILALRGSGLRFPILRAIASAHGGAIDLAITEQGSNLFFVRLPVRSEAPTADQTAALFAGVSGGEGARPAAAAGAVPAFADLSAESVQPPVDLSTEPAAPSAETEAFAQAFAAFAAAPGVSPAGETPTDASASAAAPDVATTESIMAAPGDAPPAIGLEDLWTVPGAEPAPTLESIEAAASPAGAGDGVSADAETPAMPEGPSAETEAFAQAFAAFAASPEVSPSGGTPADASASPDAETPTAPGEEKPPKPGEEPPKPFSFGSDEILTE